MRIAYLDLVGGLSGDMFLAALLDVGLPEEKLAEILAHLPGGLTLEVEEVNLFGLRAKRVKIKASANESLPKKRADLLSFIASLGIPEKIKRKVQELYEKLFEVEACVHGQTQDEVHLHELANYDTLADVVGVLYGLDFLNIKELYASPIPLARGLGHTEHGPLPFPAPATLELLKGLPIEGILEEGETVTPTGALFLQFLVKDFGPFPRMELRAIGLGAGFRSWHKRPNVVRLLLGEKPETIEGISYEEICELITDLDDETPEDIAEVCERLRKVGALEVNLFSFYGKKGRPGVRFSVLSRRQDLEKIISLLFRETGTLGIRIQEIRRVVRPREIIQIETTFGPVKVKVSRKPTLSFKPEFEDLKRISRQTGCSLSEVRRLVLKDILNFLLL